MSNGKDMTLHLIVVLIKRPRIKMSQYIPKPFKRFGGNINVKVNISNYATKIDLKNLRHIDTSIFVLKKLPGLKTEDDELDIEKLAPVPADSRKLSNVVKKMLLKSCV